MYHPSSQRIALKVTCNLKLRTRQWKGDGFGGLGWNNVIFVL